jgi:hypothetical protein
MRIAVCNIVNPSASWCRLFLHPAESAALFARFKAGNSIAARMVIMAMTTSSSISVNAPITANRAANVGSRLKRKSGEGVS